MQPGAIFAFQRMSQSLQACQSSTRNSHLKYVFAIRDAFENENAVNRSRLSSLFAQINASLSIQLDGG
jgi:hypothetical protein